MCNFCFNNLNVYIIFKKLILQIYAPPHTPFFSIFFIDRFFFSGISYYMKIKELFTLYKKNIITYAWKNKSIYKKSTTKWYKGGRILHKFVILSKLPVISY
jgi:hypothetical protein